MRCGYNLCTQLTQLMGPVRFLILSIRGSIMSRFITGSPSLLRQLFFAHPSAHFVTTIPKREYSCVTISQDSKWCRLRSNSVHLIVVHLLLTVYMLSVRISIGLMSLPQASSARYAAFFK